VHGHGINDNLVLAYGIFSEKAPLVLLRRTIKYQGSMTVAIKDIYIITRYAGNCHFDDKK